MRTEAMADTEWEVDAELQNIVRKYKILATGNAEFTQWVEKAYWASQKTGGYSFLKKHQMIRKFKDYDKRRQHYEDQLTARIHEIEGQLTNHDLTQDCRSTYLAQKDVLSKAYKFSNDKKKSILKSNSEKCAKKKKEESSEEFDIWDYLIG